MRGRVGFKPGFLVHTEVAHSPKSVLESTSSWLGQAALSVVLPEAWLPHPAWDINRPCPLGLCETEEFSALPGSEFYASGMIIHQPAGRTAPQLTSSPGVVSESWGLW